MVAWCAPEIPGRNAARMPGGLAVGAGIPKVHVPAQPIDGLSAEAAEPGAARKLAFPIGRGGETKGFRQVVLACTGEPPGPALGRAAFGGECAGEPFGSQRM